MYAGLDLLVNLLLLHTFPQDTVKSRLELFPTLTEAALVQPFLRTLWHRRNSKGSPVGECRRCPANNHGRDTEYVANMDEKEMELDEVMQTIVVPGGEPSL